MFSAVYRRLCRFAVLCVFAVMPEGFCRNSPLMRRHAPFSVALRLSAISRAVDMRARSVLVLRARFYAVCATICAGCAVCATICAGCAVCAAVWAVCAAVCTVCARGPCALRVYFKVSNNSTARFVVTVSAPPLSGSASPALSTSSPKGSPPAVRSSFI